jgi:hypothetical protein
MIANRRIRAKAVSVSVVAANAATGVANARPVRTAAGTAQGAVGQDTRPKATMTSQNGSTVTSRRTVMKNRWPSRTSTTRSGEASWAWYCRCHLMAPSTGQADSPKPEFIAEATSTPPATKAA